MSSPPCSDDSTTLADEIGAQVMRARTRMRAYRLVLSELNAIDGITDLRVDRVRDNLKLRVQAAVDEIRELTRPDPAVRRLRKGPNSPRGKLHWPHPDDPRTRSRCGRVGREWGRRITHIPDEVDCLTCLELLVHHDHDERFETEAVRTRLQYALRRDPS